MFFNYATDFGNNVASKYINNTNFILYIYIYKYILYIELEGILLSTFIQVRSETDRNCEIINING